ncbi:MAG: M20/M25/M40 family metallo-hydrolase, partial [Lachnospiraceae bacterium]|nr:M20/M25/M40 family metallo-hydrolase [Lachnospiraceae bacterium]
MKINHLEEARSVLDQIIAWRRWFHQNPESSTLEFRTTEKIRSELEKLSIPFIAASETGTVGVIRGNLPGPAVALRADIDALEITENTGLPYASETPGLMHACGHDLHTATLLGAAKILKKYENEL